MKKVTPKNQLIRKIGLIPIRNQKNVNLNLKYRIILPLAIVTLGLLFQIGIIHCLNLRLL